MQTEQSKQKLSTADISCIMIDGRRWFQKTYGNTYHSVAVRVVFTNGKEWKANSGKHYGYGDHYDQTALELFRESFDLNLEDRRVPAYLSSYARDAKIICHTTVADVARERDL